MLIGPAAGFVGGLLVARLRVVAVLVGTAVVLSAVGLPLGWFDTEDMEPLGGLIIFAVYFEIPTLCFVALGACTRRWLGDRRHGAAPREIEDARAWRRSQ